MAGGPDAGGASGERYPEIIVGGIDHPLLDCGRLMADLDNMHTYTTHSPAKCW